MKRILLNLVAWLTLISFACSLVAQDEAKDLNSTAKIRVKPDELSKKIGSAISWEKNYATALAKSKETGKPIFWYVPSVPGTFMDRKEEVNRYMLGGPFSWPSIIKLINQNCIPLKATPTKALANQFQLKVYEFVEPGFLIVQPSEEVKLSANRMTTLHPHWIFKVLANAVGDHSSWDDYSAESADSTTAKQWSHAIESNWRIESSAIDAMLESDSMSSKLLAGMIMFRSGQHDEAQRVWREASLAYPDHPLAWKAACEAQGFGPFCRGFEVFSKLPDSAFQITDVKHITSAAVPGTFDETELWNRGVDFLLGMQRDNGGFFDSDYDFGGADSLPNVHVAITSLAGLALIEAGGRTKSPEQKEKIVRGIRRVLAFVSSDANLNLADRDEILWAQAYRIRFFAAMKKTSDNDVLAEALQRSVRQLEGLQLNTGGWYHEYANSFVSATALTALFDAGKAGVVVDTNKVSSGLKRLASQRLNNGAYPYATRPENGKNEGTEKDLASSAGRISICELARRRWGQVPDEEYATAIGKSMEYHHLLAKALKYDDHTNTYAYGGFFFWYDMQARSEAIHLIADQDVKKTLANKQRELILALPEIDGCFVDSHELGRCYGTAMALLSLGVIDR